MGLKTVNNRKRKRVQRQTAPELFNEIVLERFKSLGRFKSVSKAWHAIISDPFFVRAHLHFSKQKQQQNPSSFLLTPQVLLEPGTLEDSLTKPFSTNIRFYQWNLREDSSSTAKLLCRKHFPDGEFRSVSQLAHCDGLVLLPTNTKTYVFNPATKDAIALPGSQRNMMMHDVCLPIGFGFDASTGRYKVARSFYRSYDCNPVGIIAMGMEVFIIGNGGSWRETSADPPYPMLSSQTGKHCKGHLFYFINKNNQQQPPRGLLRFSLQNETFGITLLPSNMDPTVEDTNILVKELDGELCFTYLSKHLQQLVIWMTRDVLNPQWDCRYVINSLDQCYPMATLGNMASLGGNGILLRCGNCLFRYDLEAHGVREDEIFDVEDLRYIGPGDDTLGHTWKNVCWYDIISYTESLVPITDKASSK
ncbi:unnamed protein product [Urochloa humidicola]